MVKNIPWVFSGIDAGETNIQLAKGSSDVLNGQFLRNGELTKRNGTVLHETNGAPFLASFKDKLITHGDAYDFVYNQNDNTFTTLYGGDAHWTDIYNEQVESFNDSSGYHTVFTDFMEFTGLKLYTYTLQTTTAGAYVCYIIAKDSDGIIISGGSLTVNSSSVIPVARIFSVDGYPVIVYNDGDGDFYRMNYNLNGSYIATGLTGLTSVVPGILIPLWDGDVLKTQSPEELVITYTNQVDGYLGYITSGSGTEASIVTGYSQVDSLAIHDWSAQGFFGVTYYSQDDGACYLSLYESASKSLVANELVYTCTGSDLIINTSIVGIDGSEIQVIISTTAANADGTADVKLIVVSCGDDAVPNSTNTICTGSYAITKPILIGSEAYLFVGAGDLNEGLANITTAVLISTSYNGFAVKFAGKTLTNSLYIWANALIPPIRELSTDHYTTSLSKKTGLLTQRQVATHIIWNYEPKALSYNDGVVFSGSLPRVFNGETLTEMGFLHPPEIGLTATTGGSLDAGEYSYVAIYEWKDASGNIWRSNSSVPKTVTTTAVNNAVTVNIKTISTTNKLGVRIILYRTTVDGSVHYEVTPLTNSLSYVSYTDTTADSLIDSKELVYTDQGIIGYQQPESFRVGNFCLGRMFYCPRDRETFIQYSNQFEEDSGIGFTGVGEIFLSEDGGAITGIETLQDRIIAFKENSIHILSGEGINQAGTALRGILWGDFPAILSNAVGCDNQRSILRTDSGIAFHDQKGLYMLSTDLQLSHFGKSVKQYDDTYVGAFINREKECYIWVGQSNSLVYFYRYNAWVRWDGIAGTSATQIGNDIYFKSGTNKIIKETTTKTDLTVAFNMEIMSPWFSFGGINGYSRLKRVYLLGWSGDSGGDITIDSAYNFQPCEYATDTSNTSLVPFDYTAYFTDYGLCSDMGETPSFAYQALQLQWHPHRQSCSSVRLRITCTHSDISLSALTFTIDSKKGGARLGSGRKF